MRSSWEARPFRKRGLNTSPVWAWALENWRKVPKARDRKAGSYAVQNAQKMDCITRIPYRTSHTPPAHRQTPKLPLGKFSGLCLDGVGRRMFIAVLSTLLGGIGIVDHPRSVDQIEESSVCHFLTFADVIVLVSDASDEHPRKLDRPV